MLNTLPADLPFNFIWAPHSLLTLQIKRSGRFIISMNHEYGWKLADYTTITTVPQFITLKVLVNYALMVLYCIQ